MESTRDPAPEQVGTAQEKAEILRHFNQIYWDKLNYHREKEYRIFVWTCAILFGAVATLVVSKTGEVPVYLRYGLCGRFGASLAFVAWTALSVAMQMRERKLADSYAPVIVRIGRLLHGFDAGYFHGGGEHATLLPREWENWTTESQASLRTRLMKNYIPVTCAVGVFCIVLPWLQSRRLGLPFFAEEGAHSRRRAASSAELQAPFAAGPAAPGQIALRLGPNGPAAS